MPFHSDLLTWVMEWTCLPIKEQSCGREIVTGRLLDHILRKGNLGCRVKRICHYPGSARPLYHGYKGLLEQSSWCSLVSTSHPVLLFMWKYTDEHLQCVVVVTSHIRPTLVKAVDIVMQGWLFVSVEQMTMWCFESLSAFSSSITFLWHRHDHSSLCTCIFQG